MPIYQHDFIKGETKQMAFTLYIASKFHSRYRLRPIKKHLQSLGFIVLSKWMDPDVNVEISSDNDSLGPNIDASIEEAQRDSEEIKKTDIFIIDTIDESNTGGRDVELGMAIFSDCTCFRIGPIRNVFHAMIPSHKSWADMICYLQENFKND